MINIIFGIIGTIGIVALAALSCILVIAIPFIISTAVEQFEKASNTLRREDEDE